MHLCELILGLPYLSARKLIRQTDKVPAERHQFFQRTMLNNLLNHACREIPFYRNLRGKITKENAIEVLGTFPLMTKRMIKLNIDSLQIKNRARLKKVKTSGSTGNTLSFYYDRFVTRQREKAFIWDLWGRVGYQPGDRIASFKGHRRSKNTLFEHDRIFNVYRYSIFDVKKSNIHQIIQSLNRIQPTFFHGYPSTLYQLCKLICNLGYKISFSPKAALCGSERLPGHYRKFISETLKCRVFSWYGHSEYVVLGGECEVSSAYHLYPQYGYVEFLPTDVFTKERKRIYEIVATGFNNMAMPFIRYRTADYAVLGSKECSCGRHYPLVEEVIGRVNEFIVDAENSLISVTALVSCFEKLAAISEFLFIQREPGKVVLQISGDHIEENGTKNLVTSMIENVVSDRLAVTIELVDAVEKTEIGKQSYLRQYLEITKYLEP